ncbi:MAG: hypothetical protein GTO41_26415 [Burkholderiales bacterium]|nr:hypothetical protein [Burkholderiales bacterium]
MTKATEMADDAPTLLKLEKKALDIGNRLDAKMQARRDKKGHKKSEDKEPRYWNWASKIHHPCRRHLCYARLHWFDATPSSIDSQYRFQEGEEQEDKVVEMLAGIGITLQLGQLELTWPKYRIKGRLDGAIAVGRHPYPCEIVSIQPWYWETTRTIDQVKGHSKFWIRGKPSQLNTYLLMKSEPGGFLIIKTFGKRPRVLPMMLDYDLAEHDVQTAEAVNTAVEKRELLPRIDYDSGVCGLCDYEHLCQPIKVAPQVPVGQAEYEDMVRYLDLREAEEERRALHRKLVGDKKKPGLFYGKYALVNDIEVSTKRIRQRYANVPPDVREKYMDEREIVRTTIDWLGGPDEGESD